jgi:methylmalonyl-CoA mutase C-terminal domain/subunit
MQRRYRVVVARPGLDDHDRHDSGLALSLRDAGFEVIDAGPVHDPDQVVATAVQEDADAVGLSVTAATRDAVLPAVAAGLRSDEADGVIVFDTLTLARSGSSEFDTAWLERALDAREAQFS